MSNEQIAEKARTLALNEADFYFAQLDLTEAEKTFVLAHAKPLFDSAMRSYDSWAESVDLRPIALSAALAVAVKIADRIDHHVNRLVKREKGA